MKVALLEDDYAYRQILTEFLDDQGYEYTPADHPGRLEDEEIESFEALIVDVMIGNDRAAGIDFILRIQERLRKDALLVFITNFGRESQLVEERLARVRHPFKWLEKPVNTVTLGEMLQEKEGG